MWKAGTLPSGLAHIYSLTDETELRDFLRKPGLEAEMKAAPPVPARVTPISPSDDAGNRNEDVECEDDDETSSHMPGMTPGPEDDAWGEMLGSLTDDQMGKLVDGLRELLEKAKAREKAEAAEKAKAPERAERTVSKSFADDDFSFDAVRDRLGL